MEKKVTEKKTVRKTPLKKTTKAVTKAIFVDEKKETIHMVPTGEFIKTIGRRKEASAQVKLFSAGTGKITVNNREYKDYFPTAVLNETLLAPLKLAARDATVDVSALVRGGGMRGQAEAVRLGISRALLLLDENLRKTLKKSSFLKRDPRVKERKKYGLKKARRAPQWAKR